MTVPGAMNQEIVRESQIKKKTKLNVSFSKTSSNERVSDLANKCKKVKKVMLTNISSKSARNLRSNSTSYEKSNSNSNASFNSVIDGGKCIKPRKIKKVKRRIDNLLTTLLNKSNSEETSLSKSNNLESKNSLETVVVDSVEPRKKIKDIAKQSTNMGIPEIVITDDTPLPLNNRSTNSNSSASKNTMPDIIIPPSDSLGNKRKSMNDSLVILQEINRDHGTRSPTKRSRVRKSLNDSLVILQEVSCEPGKSPPSKKKCVREANNDSHINIENSSDNIINLCDDEVSILEVDIVSPKQNPAPTEDIILLETSPEIAEIPQNVIPVPIRGRKRVGTCTVTSGGGNAGSSTSTTGKNYGSMLNVFRQPSDGIADNTVSSTSSLFAFDKAGSRHYKRQNKFRKFKQRPTHHPGRQESTFVPSSSNVSKPPTATSDGSNPYGSNIYNPNPQTSQVSGALRPVIIDGSNVALGHSNGARIFSCRGLQICVNYFAKRGHQVIVFVPQFRRSDPSVADKHIFDDLQKAGQIVFTPSRRVEGRLVVSYDDRYIVQYAAEFGGVIVSTDNYRDLLQENEAWRETIQNRLLMFTWVGDLLMFPLDPLGRNGPKLDEFLRFPPKPSTCN